MSNAGHYPMLETSMQLVTVMEAFMEKHGDTEQEQATNEFQKVPENIQGNVAHS